MFNVWKKLSAKLSVMINNLEEDLSGRPTPDTSAALKAARTVITRTVTSSGF